MPTKEPHAPQRSSKRTKPRRTSIRRSPARVVTEFREALRSPMFAWGVMAMLLFVLGAGAVAIWTRGHALVAVGRVMNETRTVRVEFVVEDLKATEDAREVARQNTPRVLVAELAVLDAMINSIQRLPATLAGVESLEEVEEGIRSEFTLTEEEFQAVRAHAVDGEPSATWTRRVRTLAEELRRRPTLSSTDWQIASSEGVAPEVEIRVGDKRSFIPLSSIVNVEDRQAVEEVMHTLARRRAGFSGPELQVVLDRLLGTRETPPTPTYRYDAALSTAAQDQAAAAVETVVRKNPVGTPIFTRGQVLDQASLDKYRQELRHYHQDASRLALTLERLGVFAAVGVLALAAFGYVALYAPRIRRNAVRMFTLVGLMVGTLAVSGAATVVEPRLIAMTATAPIILLTVIILVAYGQRMALAVGMLQGLLTVIALRSPSGGAMLVTLLLGVGIATWQLRDIRDRQTLIKMGAFVGLALAVGTIIASLLARPLVPEQRMQTLIDAAWAGVGGLAVGAISLSILSFSWLERGFDVATGMTLIELRDPKQTLLRRLQRQAPGTYNHSLNVASIAEAAADAIGADALLTYVGALYHDIGKMNKPEYFVENQSGGYNKHEKLSPAMSLLVIVGHVKDGLEMAREFDLPRPVQHFIEAHHGTTLVEFFYQRAREQAAGEKQPDVREVEYRYPGPKPRTREVAIVMLADAVESTTRTMADPTPSRIDQLVRELANKRLLDGQFDECDLTLSELNAIVDSISKSVASIYHGRIAYPRSEAKAEKHEREEKRA